MKLLLTILLCLTPLLSANEHTATKSDIEMILKVMQANKVDLENQIKATKSDLENQIKATKLDLENQMKATNMRIDDVNHRIDDINGYMLALIAGIFATIGFMWWDRRTMISKAKEEVTHELQHKFEQKADHALLIKLLNAIQELAKEDKRVDTALKKQGLSYA
jgi:cellobiose-specific phosphotransferase system component IIC